MSTEILTPEYFRSQLKTYIDMRLSVFEDTSLTDDQRKEKLALLTDANDELNQSYDVFERMIEVLSIEQYLIHLGDKIELSDLAPYAKKTELTPLAKKTDLTPLAKKTDLTPLAKKTDLAPYAKTTAINTLLSSYKKWTEVKQYYVTLLGSYVTTSALSSALNNYISLDALTSHLSKYLKKSDISTALTAYAEKSQLLDYVKTSDLPNSLDTSDFAHVVPRVIAPLKNGAKNVSGFSPIKYYKIGNMVFIQGSCEITSTFDDPIIKLPAGFTPTDVVRVSDSTTNAIGNSGLSLDTDVTPAGNVTVFTNRSAVSHVNVNFCFMID